MTTTFVVGVDFGTSHSGFAFSTMGEQAIRYKGHWAGNSMPYPKTRTTLLYAQRDEGWKKVSWGWDAVIKYESLTLQERSKHHLVERFKLALVDDPTIKLPQGLTAFRVVTDYLAYMVEAVDAHLTEIYQEAYQHASVKWCLTVPAGWSAQAKDDMSKAAIAAGMVSAATASTHLLLLHEPEAACLAVLKDGQSGTLSGGQTVMIIDAGGGTVDITLHKVSWPEAMLELHECTHREMEMQGSTFIDQRFEKMMEDVLGPCYRQWCERKPQDRVAFVYSTWEHVKCTHSLADPKSAVVRLPASLVARLPDDVRERLEDQGEDDRVILSAAQMNRLFDPSVSAVITASERMIIRFGSPPDHIFVVGGFGSSHYLLGRIREAFQNSVAKQNPNGEGVSSPASAASAILEGAVRYGQAPTAVRTRRSALTYGVRCSGLWVENKFTTGHDEVFDGVKKCTVSFQQFVTRDEELSADHTVTHSFWPTSNGQEVVSFDIFATRARSAEYTTEPGMFKLGKLSVSGLQAAGLGTRIKKKNYKIVVTMKFGGVAIEVQAEDAQTKNKFTTAIEYKSRASA